MAMAIPLYHHSLAVLPFPRLLSLRREGRGVQQRPGCRIVRRAIGDRRQQGGHCFRPPVCSSLDCSSACSDSLPRVSLDRASESRSVCSFFIHTMGCQMNVADSERMAGLLLSHGYCAASSPDNASLLILNTCSIREKAEQKVYSALGRQRSRKYKDPHFRIVVAGCVAQQEGERLLRRVPEVDLVLGPRHVGRLLELLDQVDQGSQICATEPIHIMEDITKPDRESKVSAWVNAIYGCNECCTYCIVPGVRGREQSRHPEAIRQEMLALGQAGYREVTLLGQNIDAYGRDLDSSVVHRRWTLADLLLYIHDVPGIERIRFVTSHPKYFTEGLIKTCAELPKICKHFHIPFQSGDDEILKAMRRGYTVKRYLTVIETIRRYIPDASISADAIVGFPGETEQQFSNTLKLMEEVKFDMVNTAAYSPRPRTPAASWINQVADLVKEDRLHRINKLVLEHALKCSWRYMNRVEKILVESKNMRSKNEHQLAGRTDGNKRIFFEGGEELIGAFVNVQVNEITATSLRGLLCD
eukprot:c23620_g1_i1 orf=478-2061(-)